MIDMMAPDLTQLLSLLLFSSVGRSNRSRIKQSSARPIQQIHLLLHPAVVNAFSLDSDYVQSVVSNTLGVVWYI